MLRKHRAVAASLALLPVLVTFAPAQNRDNRDDFEEPALADVTGLRVSLKTSQEPPQVRPRVVSQKTGIQTSRLSRTDLSRWREIEKLVLATDSDGAPLYPTLRGLYDWVNRSGHAVYVEVVSTRASQSNTAGSFTIEKLDAAGWHAGVIRLNLKCIDRAQVSDRSTRPNGFMPFEKLKRNERYAEVLGHELAHARYILSNLLRTYFVRELVEVTNGLVLFHARVNAGRVVSPEMKQLLRQRDQLLMDLEADADVAEEAVWREIVNGRKVSSGLTIAANRRKF